MNLILSSKSGNSSSRMMVDKSKEVVVLKVEKSETARSATMIVVSNISSFSLELEHDQNVLSEKPTQSRICSSDSTFCS
ncbi:hypothetical protein K503DRAFT_34099 [Rhizopogon vinicolor AM-OR11-026]|uniref:Uncharacterized protein n=1 Tax=Rhizopogon vinicolor AM-OR11-026 TaxID=1314800 RepID=A0A1B7MH48_9AGAM|nr:hypothetical protein K503DRAFT_34099 [Rhizopogon vinicolor AM-OR11-026]